MNDNKSNNFVLSMNIKEKKGLDYEYLSFNCKVLC
jgi:hypothetical protein